MLNRKLKQKLIQQALEKKLKGAEKSDALRAKEYGQGEIPERFYRFDQHPGYKQAQIMKAGADRLGLESPYFRVHEGSAGATTRVDGCEYINFTSYNYLGLSGHPEVNQAAIEAVERYGTSVSGARLGSGERPVHRELERALAKHYEVDDAVAFVSGHATNVSTVGYLFGKRDLILHDQLIHNSVVVGAQLSGARRMSFPHNDYQELDRLLLEQRKHFERVLVVVEGLYGMDGDFPDLPTLVQIKRRHKAFLMVDEAHSLGTLGANGGGLREQFAVDGRDVDIWMGTLSKTLAGCGGYIAGEYALVEHLRLLAPGFLYSVGLPAQVAAPSLAALSLMHQEPERVERLHQRSGYFLQKAKAAGLDTGLSQGIAVIPVVTGSSIRAVELSGVLFKQGINVQPIVYPGVPEKSARLRFFVSSEHTDTQIDRTIQALQEAIC